MKKFLILFGILDIVTLVRAYGHWTNLLGQWGNFHWITVGNLLIYASLIFSSYFLIKQNKVGLWLTYGQFPLRLLFMVLSFNFLLTVTRFLDDGQVIYRILMWLLLGLEVMRLLITIQLHRNYYMATKPSLT
jgi:hypothetical protein